MKLFASPRNLTGKPVQETQGEGERQVRSGELQSTQGDLMGPQGTWQDWGGGGELVNSHGGLPHSGKGGKSGN